MLMLLLIKFEKKIGFIAILSLRFIDSVQEIFICKAIFQDGIDIYVGFDGEECSRSENTH